MMHKFNDACGSVQLETRGLVLAEDQYLPLEWRIMIQDSCLKLKTKKKEFFVITGRGRVWVDAAITFTTQETLYGIH